MKVILLLIAQFVLIPSCFAGLSSYDLKPVHDAIVEYMNKQSEYVSKKNQIGTWKQIGFSLNLPENLGRVHELGKGAISWSPDYDASTSQYEKCDLIIDPDKRDFKIIQNGGGFSLISYDYVDRKNKKAGNRNCEILLQELQMSSIDKQGVYFVPGSNPPLKMLKSHKGDISPRSKDNKELSITSFKEGPDNISGIITNVSGKVCMGAYVQIDYYDSNGVRIGMMRDYLKESIASADTAVFSVYVTVESFDSFSIAEIGACQKGKE